MPAQPGLEREDARGPFHGQLPLVSVAPKCQVCIPVTQSAQEETTPNCFWKEGKEEGRRQSKARQG